MDFLQRTTSHDSESVYLARIDTALLAASRVAEQLFARRADARCRAEPDTFTADYQINRVLREHLLQSDEGWLSEEDLDDCSRLSREVVWVVDPLDGTLEFRDSIPEWSISVALVANGVAIAGGVINPATNESFLGSINTGVTYNGKPCTTSKRTTLEGAMFLASRREYLRGDWQKLEGRQFCVRPVGSIAYKLALVAAGVGDATWTLQPKNEWDIAAGVALVTAAGGRVRFLKNAQVAFNRHNTKVSGLIAGSLGLWDQVVQLIDT